MGRGLCVYLFARQGFRPMSKMWERRIADLSSRVATLEKTRSALQVVAEPELFPSLEASRPLIKLDRLLEDAKSSLQAAQAQDRLQDAYEARRKLDPLQPTKNRDGLYRSSASREAAILGFLERERRRVAPLTREAFSRAQSTDASGSSLKYKSFSGFSYDPQSYEFENKPKWMDPCVEYYTQRKMRRAVMFANGSAGRGYSGQRKSRKPSGC